MNEISYFIAMNGKKNPLYSWVPDPSLAFPIKEFASRKTDDKRTYRQFSGPTILALLLIVGIAFSFFLIEGEMLWFRRGESRMLPLKVIAIAVLSGYLFLGYKNFGTIAIHEKSIRLHGPGY